MFLAFNNSHLIYILLKNNNFGRDFYNILNIHTKFFQNRDQKCGRKTFKGLKVDLFFKRIKIKSLSIYMD